MIDMSYMRDMMTTSLIIHTPEVTDIITSVMVDMPCMTDMVTSVTIYIPYGYY